MTARRNEFLDEMGLGPIWRLRAREESGSGIRDSGSEKQDSGSRIQDPGSGIENLQASLKREESSTSSEESARIPPTTAQPAGEDRAASILRMAWPELKAAVANCTACPLSKSRTQSVFGIGDEHAEWLLVGEAPGAEEDARGEPFVGQAGRLLDNMLASIGLTRGDNIYIANVLKCRPPRNRNPEAYEVAQCSPHLMRQIELIQPKLILAMGRFAVQALLDTDASIASLRGKRHRYRGVPLVVTYHPAYLLRNLPDKAKAWEDLCFARRVMADLKSGQGGN
ncbi:MAG: uracil-DNA glycosylase [Betaproteobacteria bacterium]|nr:uracil-DNA glycosylase [Betaproteobacteria bacterium]